MHKEDHAYRIIRRTANKLPQIIRQHDVGRLTDELKIYQGQEIQDDWYITGHQWDISNIYWRRVFETQTSTGSPLYYVLQKLVNVIPCLAYGNTEVDKSLSENCNKIDRRCHQSDWIHAHKMQQNAKAANESQGTQNILNELESRERSLSEVHKTLQIYIIGL